MKHLLLALLSLVFYTGKGAIILDQGNATPLIGSSYIKYLADTNITEGSGGAAVNWVYNNLIITGATIQANCIDPATTAYGSSFPSANIAIDDLSTIQYITGTASGLQLHGEGSTSGLLQFNTPINYLTFPFAYGSIANNNNVPGTAPAGTVDASYTVTADAYGSLEVNGVTFSDVLRVKTVKDFIYNLTGLGIISEYTVIYSWYDGVSPLPVFEIFVSDVTGAIQAHTRQVRVSSVITKTDDFSNGNPVAVLFPNPAHSEVKISGNHHSNINSIRILNTAGVRVKEITEGMSILSESIDVSDLSAGCYFVEINAENRQVLKLVIY